MPKRPRRSLASRAAYRDRIHAYERTPEWKVRSLNFRRSKRFKCYACGRIDMANHAHHLTYDRAFTGKEPDSDLMCLCSDCHLEVHRFARDSHESLRTATARTVRVIRARNKLPRPVRPARRKLFTWRRSRAPRGA